MKRSPNSLELYFRSVQQLIEKMQDNANYDDEVKDFFIKAIPMRDMTKDELIRHFENMIRQSETITIKLGGWLEGFKNEYLKNHTPNELLNEKLVLPEYNMTMTTEELKKFYGLKQPKGTVYRWIREVGLIPSSKSGTRRYYRVDFEDMLVNRGTKFDVKRVEKLIKKIAIDPYIAINK